MLMLNTVGRRKEVIISRGELIEIGGSFRLPEVMKLSGCKLKEIGTTNKTHLDDYREAIYSRTGAILLCHPSNYEINGFAEKPEIADIVTLAGSHGIPVIYDLGSGSLIDTQLFGSDSEPKVSEIVSLGVDLVSFSGDKLLGGPQAGIIVGREAWVRKCKRNHLLRTIRLDKLMIKCLQTVLIQYLNSDIIPVNNEAVALLTSTPEEVKRKCDEFLNNLPPGLRADFTIRKSYGKVGSGAYPLMKLDSWVIDIVPRRMSANTFAKKLRKRNIPVFCYIDDDHIRIDLRTVADDEMSDLRDAIIEIT